MKRKVKTEPLKNLYSERARMGKTQSELAEELGVSKYTISNWENGNAPINADALIVLARKFRCSTDYLLGMTEERLPHKAAD